MKPKILILLSLMIAGISSSRAENPEPATKEMALDALVRQALEKNPELNFYAAEIAAAKGERRTAGEWANTELSTEEGAKITRDYHGKTLGDGVLWTLGATQAFEYPGRVTLRKAIANHQIAVAELGLEGFRIALASRVRALQRTTNLPGFGRGLRGRRG